MKNLIAALLACTCLSGVADAAEAPVMAPVPAWVKPVMVSIDTVAPDDAPVRLLLSDQQVSLAHLGQTVYSHVAYRIQTPQGLPAGNVAFAWRPDTDTLTVHSLVIHRGPQVIDVLASGQTFTVVRRETNLEIATLDGVLTATLQPEGLQVGDTVEFEASIVSRDPVLKGHVEQFAGAWNDYPVSQAHLRISWPDEIAVRIRATAALPRVKTTKASHVTTVELSLASLNPIVPPKGAPLRYRMGRLVELTDFASWADLAALMSPLYASAAVLPTQGPLRVELERIRSASADPKTRAEAVLALVQDRVRYVALAIGAGGLVPADAATTWSRRFGDCKGKTALLIALLQAMDIEAEPVLVNTVMGDGLDVRLPMVALFNHVLVRAKIAGKVYWLDGTRTGDTALDRLEIPAFGWGLPIRASGAALVRMLPAPLEVPSRETSIRIDATTGLSSPAPTTIETVVRGNDAIQLKANLANLNGAARDTALREFWKGQYDFVDIKTAGAVFDPKTGEERLTMSGAAKMDWSGNNYETDGTRVGYRADFSRDAGSSPDTPYAVDYPSFNRTREVIVLPKGQGEFRIGKATEVDQSIAGIQYRRRATISENIYTIEKTERAIAPEFAASEAASSQTALRSLAEKSARIEKPAGYESTSADVAAAKANEPTTSDGYVNRAQIFLDKDMKTEALRDYDKAAALDPANIYAWANRAITRVQIGDYAGARADIAKADTIDLRFGQTLIARGMLADAEYRPADAITAYSAALKSNPGNGYALAQRSVAYALLGDADRAIADMTSQINAAPDDASHLIDRANYQADMGRLAAAATDYSRAIAMKPSVFAYLNRASHRPAGELALGSSDIDEALRLEPENPVALAAKAELAASRQEWSNSLDAYSRALTNTPSNGSLQISRGVVYALSGDAVRAEKDFAAARILSSPSDVDNDLCWQKATHGVSLQSALKDCEAAVARAPTNYFGLDSYGFVLLRLGRFDDAIAAYDRALTVDPYLPTAFYGRAIAYARKGNTLRAKANFMSAERITPSVKNDFARHGVTPP
jgi:tetratricopeptide (TPR) repeat protein